MIENKRQNNPIPEYKYSWKAAFLRILIIIGYLYACGREETRPAFGYSTPTPTHIPSRR